MIQKENQELRSKLTVLQDKFYKIQGERDFQNEENKSLRAELKRIYEQKIQEKSQLEMEVKDKLRINEDLKEKLIQLNKNYSELEIQRISKIEFLKDEEFMKQNKELNYCKSKLIQSEIEIRQFKQKIEYHEKIQNKNKLIIGDMHFQNLTLKEQVAYLSNFNEKNKPQSDSYNILFMNQGNSQLLSSGLQQYQIQKENMTQNKNSENYKKMQSPQLQVQPKGGDPHSFLVRSFYQNEGDNLANFYKDLREKLNIKNQYLSESTLVTQNINSFY